MRWASEGVGRWGDAYRCGTEWTVIRMHCRLRLLRLLRLIRLIRSYAYMLDCMWSWTLFSASYISAFVPILAFVPMTSARRSQQLPFNTW
jgi:hypothetical protein